MKGWMITEEDSECREDLLRERVLFRAHSRFCRGRNDDLHLLEARHQAGGQSASEFETSVAKVEVFLSTLDHNVRRDTAATVKLASGGCIHRTIFSRRPGRWLAHDVMVGRIIVVETQPIVRALYQAPAGREESARRQRQASPSGEGENSLHEPLA